MNIAVLTPSRGRPDRFAEMVDAIRMTSTTAIQIYLATDYDDAVEYPQIDGVYTFCGPRQRLAAWTNALAHEALDDGADILAFFGDDHRPRTQGWDQRVITEYGTLGSGLVYCADGLQNERLPTAPFWSADVIRALGWFYPPTLNHLYADDAWLALATDLDRCRYLPDVLIEHMHYSAGKAEPDDLNRENDAFYERDRDEFLRILAEDHPDNVDRVKAAIG